MWTLGAYENQILPFEDLIYDPYFSESGSSFEIPVFFLYQKSFMLTGRIHSSAGDLEIVPLRSESPGAVFEVMFAIVDREEEGPRLQLEYNPQFFKSTTIQRYLRLFLNLLDSALTTPDSLVDKLSILSTTERAHLLVEPNRTAADFGPSRRCTRSSFAVRSLNLTQSRPPATTSDGPMRNWHTAPKRSGRCCLKPASSQGIWSQFAFRAHWRCWPQCLAS